MFYNGLFGKTYTFDDRDFDSVDDFRVGGQFANFDNPRLLDAIDTLISEFNLDEDDLKKSTLMIEDGIVTIHNNDNDYSLDF